MAPFTFDALAVPIVQAPMAGGASTPALAAAVSGAGGLGFLAAGYKPLDAVRTELEQLRALLPDTVPFGINVFAPPGHGAGTGDVAAYAETLRGEAERGDAALGVPRWDDDRYAEKLDLLCEARVPVVSFTFGCPPAEDVERLQRAGAAVWVTVTTPDEADAASAAGADAVIVQGVEAGGHRGGFDDGAPGELGLLALLQLVRATVGDRFPLVATGGIVTGHAVAGGSCVRRRGRATRHRVHALPRSGDGARAPRRDRRRPSADRADAGVHRPHRAGHRQPLPA